MSPFLAGIPSTTQRQLVLAELARFPHAEPSRQGTHQAIRIVEMDSDVLAGRKPLYAKCHHTFLQVQELRRRHRRETSGSLRSGALPPVRDLVHSCQGYRREIWSRFNGLAVECEASAGSSQTQQFEQEMFSIWRMYSALHLVEIVLLADTPNALVMEHLLDWVNSKHCDELIRLKVSMRDILSHMVPSRHPSLWATVTELAIRGRFEDLLAFLNRLLQKDNNEAVLAVSDGQELIYLQKVISKYPSLRIMRTSETDFNGRWRLWQSEVSAAKDRTQNAELKDILSILSGDVHIMAKYCKTWRERFVFGLYHQSPCVQVNQLQAHLDSNKSLSNVDELMAAILRLDISKFSLEASLIDPWFAAITIDVLDAAGKVEPEVGGIEGVKSDSVTSLRDYLSIAYGSIMAGDLAYWETGLDVLSSCGFAGHEIMKEFVVRIPLTDVNIKDRVSAYCLKRNLQYEKNQICAIYARQALDNEDFGSAITSFIESQDASYLSDILERIMSKYVESSSSMEFDDILTSAGVHIGVHAELLFLDDFSQACDMVREQNLKGAAACFAQLLSVDHTPMKFVPIILLECLKLMRTESGLFSTSDLFEILRHIEDILLSYRRDEYLDFAMPKEDGKASAEKDLKNLRLLSIQNLANSFTSSSHYEHIK